MLELEVHGWERRPNSVPPGRVVRSSVLQKWPSWGTPSLLYSRYFDALSLMISFIILGFLTGPSESLTRIGPFNISVNIFGE